MKKSFKFGVILLFLFTAYQITGGPGEALYYNNASLKEIKPVISEAESPLGNYFSSLSPESRQNISRNKLQSFLENKDFVNLVDKHFDIFSGTRRFQVNTTIQVPLQKFMLASLDTNYTRYISVVVMEPGSGRILSMVSYDRENPANNPCISNRFPAASIFKIVTAAAAIEKCGLHSDSQLKYNGGKYTLYKSQLKDRNTRYTRHISLQDSFAQSINPIFGKIGVHYLGKSTLEEYAEAFGFNRNIMFEIPLETSHISVSDEPYHWAEIASGFNRETAISPLHGALMVSTILNQGMLVAPSIIDQIRDDRGKVLYQSRSVILNRALTSQTSAIILKLMHETIESGTCRKAFRGYQKDDILSQLHIGGKTGSIGSRKYNGRYYDWFVGFAQKKDSAEKIVVAAFVAHEKRIGTKAKKYARMAMKEYFRSHLKSIGEQDMKNLKDMTPGRSMKAGL